MNVLALDVETTTIDNGHPFNPDNRLCTVGIGCDRADVFDIEYSTNPYRKTLDSLAVSIVGTDLLVGFNIKFDLHWLARYGVKPRPDVKLWDCQLAHFMLTGQKIRFPDLDTVCKASGIEGKLDLVKQYWDQGYDTPEIPYNILAEYQADDVQKTFSVFLAQSASCDEIMYNNILNASTDQLVTAEMERNGILYDVDLSLEKGKELEEEIFLIDQELNQTYSLPIPEPINWNSNKQLSLILYGGTFEYEVKEPYTFFYKSGATKEKLRTVVKQHMCQRLVDPLRGTETKAEGIFKTDESTLLSLKPKNVAAKQIISLVLARAKLEKKLGTYYYGIPKIIEEKNWQGNFIHPQLNHCVAETGRLSSSKPNGQNIDGEVLECLITRCN
jgi:DNA polymerase I-like protein with 3'-5' exonuclease and polymerase domains